MDEHWKRLRELVEQAEVLAKAYALSAHIDSRDPRNGDARQAFQDGVACLMIEAGAIAEKVVAQLPVKAPKF